MGKQLLPIFLLVLLLFFAVPVFAAYQVEQLPNGDFQVKFTYQSTATEVYLAGEFNDWNAQDSEYQLFKNTDGVYEITIILTKGRYEYKFVADGEWKADPDNPEKAGDYGNSLLTLTAGSILGELGISGEMINEFYREGQDGPVAMNNDLKIKVEGTLQQTIDGDQIDRFDYMAEIKGENDLDDLAKDISAIEYLSLDQIYISRLDLTLLTDYANVSLQGNMEDNTDSYDYLGLVDATTVGDDRDYTQNINDSGNNRRIKITPGKAVPADYDFHVNLTEYSGDISDIDAINKYFSNINFLKNINDPVTGLMKGKVGLTGVLYQPVVAGTVKELAQAATVFGEYEPLKNLIVRGQYAYIPLGYINESLSGCYQKENGNWVFTFDPRDYDDWEVEDVETVWLAGAGAQKDGGLNQWDSTNQDFTLEKQERSGGTVWTAEFSGLDPAVADQWKFIVNGEWYGQPPGNGDNFRLENPAPDQALTGGEMYMAEVNYRRFDPRRSFKTGDDFYNFDLTVGYEVLENEAYLPVAKDRLASSIGHNRLYLHTYYYPLNGEDLKLTFDGDYQSGYDDLATAANESEEFSVYVVTPGFDYPQPTEGMEYLKGHVNFGRIEEKIEDPGQTTPVSYQWKEERYKGFDRLRTIFLEGKTEPVGPFNYFLASLNNEKNLKVNELELEAVTELFVEAELDIPVEQIAYLKGNVDYKLNDQSGGEQRRPRYWVETKFHHIPQLQDYITHILLNYESDVDGVIDQSIYIDNDNDWQNRFYAETKLLVPGVDNFETKVSLESQYLEDDVYPDLDGLDENLNAKYVVAGKNIEWYTLTTISTGYTLDYGIRLDLSFKYDLNHGEISKYEDDAIKLEMSKEISDFTTLKASYNSKHPDYSSEQFVNVMLETLF